MNRMLCSTVHIARFTLQTKTALSIGSGGADGVYDHPIVRDANDLPCIPGTSLAGVLRHLWFARYDETSTARLFGYQDHDQGEASRVEIAACALQDSRGEPVEGLSIEEDALNRIQRDELLRAAQTTKQAPLFRDRVRIGHKGVADDAGKFDRGLLPAGYRFSGELRLWSEAKNDSDWPMLLGLLDDRRLRLGGATRAGMGALELVRLHAGSFDLSDPGDVARFSSLSMSLNDVSELSETDTDTLPKSNTLRTLSILLEAQDFWRFGQGNEALGRLDNGKIPDLLPKLEPLVKWRHGKANISTRLALVPGSAIKGALAHRTAFHWNALNEHFVDDMPIEEVAEWDKSKHCMGIREVFGYAKDKQAQPGDKQQDIGRAGQVFINDIHLEIPIDAVQTLIHNSIDRFTGGVRNRMLFSEELIYRQPIPLEIDLLPGFEQADNTARQAFARTIQDLCAGRLALGAGAAKGHGLFIGTPDQQTRDWLEENGEKCA